MTVSGEEKEFINGVVKRYKGCSIQQKEADRKLKAALLAEFNSADIAERAMRVIKGVR